MDSDAIAKLKGTFVERPKKVDVKKKVQSESKKEKRRRMEAAKVPVVSQ